MRQHIIDDELSINSRENEAHFKDRLNKRLENIGIKERIRNLKFDDY